MGLFGPYYGSNQYRSMALVVVVVVVTIMTVVAATEPSASLAYETELWSAAVALAVVLTAVLTAELESC